MEKLTEPQQAKIKKMSTVRLTTKLIAAGMTEEEVEKLDRQGMIEAWARIVLERKDVPIPTVKGYDPTLERERLALERMKFEMETKRWEEEKVEKRRREEIENMMI